MPSRSLSWFLTFLFVALAGSSLATHLRAIDIKVNRDNCSTLTVEVVVTAYVNYLGTTVKFGGEDSVLDFGDGNTEAVPETNHEIIYPDLGIGRVQYKTVHTYGTFGLYKISYREPNRNSGIINIDNPANTPIYTETAILLESGVCNTSPRLLVPPVDSACSGIKFIHTPGALDAEGDSLSYEIVTPKKDNGVSVTNFFSPDHSKFYTGDISYDEGNEEQNGPPSLKIDPTTGLLAWDAPGGPGEYVIAIKIREWKYNSSENSWYESGYVVRDMAIIVLACGENQKPELNIPSEMCVIAGTAVHLNITASDADKHDVVIEVFSELFSLSENQPAITPANGTLQSTRPPHDTASVQFVWQTSCAHVRDKPYRLFFKITDRPADQPRLAQYYTVNIKVMAPAPRYDQVSINPITKTAALQWKDYPCDNVKAFQVWRRVSEYLYEQPVCDSGMPVFLRYQLMAELPSTQYGYTDKDLAFGAQYCYRIVALIGDRKTPSRLSLDTCFIPKPAEAPVILNVSVASTDTSNGTINVRWTHPFDIDTQQYPPPYSYRILRKNDSDPLSTFQRVGVDQISDTVFIDGGLNTLDNVYLYHIELYVPTLSTAPVDSSAVASSVFAATAPVNEGIHVSWKAITPWSNFSVASPYHLIYRSNSASGPFVLIDSVNVNETDFHYTDRGQHDDVELSNGLYYYKVKTRGTYGNPEITSPLENFSQVTSGHIADTIPPCQPVAEIVKTDCAEFSCDGSDYYTRLEWHLPDQACADDITEYEILVKDDKDSIYSRLAMVTGNAFVHSNINSLNKCYAVISIDQAGNRSDTSAIVCNSNCLQFKLPNIFTPGTADQQNDFLAPYPEDAAREDCARSVRQVDLKIFSRWGTEIYTTTLTDEQSFILWNGRNNKGDEVNSGVYFYEALVTFDTHDPSLEKQQIKGWVQLIR